MKLLLFPNTENKFIRIIKNIVVYSFVLQFVSMFFMGVLPSVAKVLAAIISILFCTSLVILVFYGIGVFCRGLLSEIKSDRKMKKIRNEQEILAQKSNESEFLFKSEDEYYDNNDVHHQVKKEYFLTSDGKILLKETEAWQDAHNIIRGSRSVFFRYISLDEFHKKAEVYNEKNVQNDSVTEINEKDDSEYITLLYSKQAGPYDSKEIKLYKKCGENIYFIRLNGTNYNTGGALYFDLDENYFNNYSVEDLCDFIQEKCIWNNEECFSDFREVVKQNHTVLNLFKNNRVKTNEVLSEKYHWVPSSGSEVLLTEVICDSGGGEGIVIDSASNKPYYKWWDIGNMYGNRMMPIEWDEIRRRYPEKFGNINEGNWKDFV